ncbi:MAG: NADH-quinone oxidoreductase subunit C [Candidatus Nanopelagicales bacterium]|nr:NADH-quinone oxidoreductase subunit C [Actinomycetota bacterium]HNL51259.1 NADH-quinone oxidoreductase subunit C [Actinomycetota bacterium]HNO15360.1 NADH-quinone oxidoreductase subunit C [Actinomycetota bacterium]HUM85884.1 NADH-quinone oxidoreductase subunit C [Actinomycetota bacterium]
MSENPESAADVVPAGTETLDVISSGQGAFGVDGTPDVSGYGGLVRRVYAAPAATRPYGGWFDEAVDTLAGALGDAFGPAVSKVVIAHDQLTLEVEREHLHDVMQTLRDHPALRFEVCLGANGVHWPEDAGRELHVHYPMLSMTHNRRLSVETTCPDSDPHVPSIVDIYPGNNWHERETFDFFGVVFDGHPGLTRIEMPDDWVGHPQRKDYPLGGIPVEYKGATVPPPDTRREYK